MKDLKFISKWCIEYGLTIEDLASIQPGYDGIVTLSGPFIGISSGFILVAIGFIIYSSVLIERIPIINNDIKFLLINILVWSTSILILESICIYGMVYDTCVKKFSKKGLFHKIIS